MRKSEKENYLKWAKIGIIGFVVFKLFKPLSAASTTVADIVTKKAEDTAIKQTTGLGETDIQLCRDVANKLNNAMYVTGFFQMSWFGGSTEDEEAVIAQLNRLSTSAQAQTVSSFYATATFGKSLAADVNKYLSQDERQRIKSVIISNLS